jgi:hypothetical protein
VCPKSNPSILLHLFDLKKFHLPLAKSQINISYTPSLASMAELTAWQAFIVRDSRDSDAEARQAKVLTKDETRRDRHQHRVAAGAAWEGRVGLRSMPAEKDHCRD